MTVAKRSTFLRRIAAFARGGRFRADVAAVSAVEFALILPMLVLLFIGGNELSQAITIYRKTSHAGSALGDLVTQISTVDQNEMNNILDASRAIMAPYDPSGVKMVVGQVFIDNNRVARVRWSASRNTGKWACNQQPPITIPTGMLVPNSFLVLTSVEYTYTTVFSGVMNDIFGSSSITMRDTAYLKPRISNEVTNTSPTAC